MPVLAAQPGHDAAQFGAGLCEQADDVVRDLLVGTLLASAPRSAGAGTTAMSPIHMNSPVARKRCPAAAGVVIGGKWMSAMVADVDDFEADTRRAGHLPAQHPPDDFDRTQVVGREDGAEHHAGEDRR